MDEIRQGTVVRFNAVRYPSGGIGWGVDGITSYYMKHLWGMGERVGVVLTMYCDGGQMCYFVRLLTGEYVTASSSDLVVLEYLTPEMRHDQETTTD